LSLVWAFFMSAFPLLVLLSGIAGMETAGTVLMLVGAMSLMLSRFLLEDWIEHTRQPDWQWGFGVFSSSFSTYSLQAANLKWPWFNATRMGLLIAGLGGIVVGSIGSAIFGWS
jgi:hypothetical protein